MLRLISIKKAINITTYEFISTIITMILGTLLHFTFNWSNKNLFVGIFSAVNESTWEHLKILFFPMLLTTIIGYFYTDKQICNYICYKTKSILLSLSFIIVFFYTYTGVLGKNLAILDIASFYVAIILGEYYILKQINNDSNCNQSNSIFILIILFICFIAFTFSPPYIGIFKNPITNTYGIFERK